MRTTLKDSLIENLLYNERRQKDSIKIFEISDVYLSDQSSKKVLGIIGTGRLGKNYRDFSKKIDQNLIQDTLRDMNLKKEANVIQINRNELDTKIKSPIFYSEIDICDIENIICDGVSTYKDFVKYKKISDYPSTFRDISFAVKDASKINELEKIFYNISDNNVKDVFVFDYYENKKIGVTKIGFRIVFQSYNKTLTDIEVEDFMETIIANSLRIQSVQIPGLS
jgi:phenylalanyl-tRNA synthetase beta subunit